MIRSAERSDLAQVVAVHQAAFRGFFMTELGPHFLRGYYQQVLDYPDRLFLVWQREPSSPIEGFVAGFLKPHEFYRRLRSQKWSLALRAGIYLLWRPSKWQRVLANLRRTAQLALPPEDKSCLAELASLAVHPQSQGQSIGKALVLAFLKTAQERGAQRVYLNTDAFDNDAVNAFYQRLAFRLNRQFWHPPQRLMNEYVYDLESQQVEFS